MTPRGAGDEMTPRRVAAARVALCGSIALVSLPLLAVVGLPGASYAQNARCEELLEQAEAAVQLCASALTRMEIAHESCVRHKNRFACDNFAESKSDLLAYVEKGAGADEAFVQECGLPPSLPPVLATRLRALHEHMEALGSRSKALQRRDEIVKSLDATPVPKANRQGR